MFSPNGAHSAMFELCRLTDVIDGSFNVGGLSPIGAFAAEHP
jgi:hypothetical protein